MSPSRALRFYSDAEVAEALQVSRRTLSRLRKATPAGEEVWAGDEDLRRWTSDPDALLRWFGVAQRARAAWQKSQNEASDGAFGGEKGAGGDVVQLRPNGQPSSSGAGSRNSSLSRDSRPSRALQRAQGSPRPLTIGSTS